MLRTRLMSLCVRSLVIEPSEDCVGLLRVSFFEVVRIVCVWRRSGVTLNRASSQGK